MNLERFIKAQEYNYKIALDEIRKGRKESHWIWYIFPQISGLGYSDMAKYYGINDLDEAKTYIDNEILGDRLIEISNELLKLNADDLIYVLGDIDTLKVKSCMTLFELVSDNSVFSEVLEKYYNGERDEKSLQLVKKGNM